MTTLTVTAAQGVGSPANGLLLRVVVITGAAVTQSGVTANAVSSGPNVSHTPNQTGSRVYFAGVGNKDVGYTIEANCTQFDNIADATNAEQYLTGKRTATSTSGTPVTVGWTDAGSNGAGIAAYEVQQAGTLAEDGSAPPIADNGGVFTVQTVTTSSFTPPAGSLLVALVSSDGGVGVCTMTVSDTGGGLTWIEKAKNNPSGGDYCGVWIAQVPAAAAAAVPVAMADPGWSWLRFFQPWRLLGTQSPFPVPAPAPVTAPLPGPVYAQPGQTWLRYFRHPQQPFPPPPPPPYVPPVLQAAQTGTSGWVPRKPPARAVLGPRGMAAAGIAAVAITTAAPPQYAQPGQTWLRQFRHPQQAAGTGTPGQLGTPQPALPVVISVPRNTRATTGTGTVAGGVAGPAPAAAAIAQVPAQYAQPGFTWRRQFQPELLGYRQPPGVVPPAPYVPALQQAAQAGAPGWTPRQPPGRARLGPSGSTGAGVTGANVTGIPRSGTSPYAARKPSARARVGPAGSSAGGVAGQPQVVVAAAAGLPAQPVQPGDTWIRQFRHPQQPLPQPPAYTAPAAQQPQTGTAGWVPRAPAARARTGPRGLAAGGIAGRARPQAPAPQQLPSWTRGQRTPQRAVVRWITGPGNAPPPAFTIGVLTAGDSAIATLTAGTTATAVLTATTTPAGGLT